MADTPLMTPTQNLQAYLDGLKGHGILAGQYVNYNVAGMMDQFPLIHAQTGHTPAIQGVFFSLAKQTFNADPVALANAWLARGGIVLGMFSPGNPTFSAKIIGGPTQGPNAPHGHPVNFGNLIVPGTVEYVRWHAGLDQLATQLKAVNGPVMLRPFPEFDRNIQWWASQPPVQFVEVWQDMVAHVRSQGVSNVLWVMNLGGGSIDAMPPAKVAPYIQSYYPGDGYVDIVSLDCYPPSAANAPAIAALTATGKPVIYAEIGAVKGPGAVPEFSGDTSVALETVIKLYPQVVAVCVWPGTEALPVQNGMAAFMNNPKIIRLAELPKF